MNNNKAPTYKKRILKGAHETNGSIITMEREPHRSKELQWKLDQYCQHNPNNVGGKMERGFTIKLKQWMKEESHMFELFVQIGILEPPSVLISMTSVVWSWSQAREKLQIQEAIMIIPIWSRGTHHWCKWSQGLQDI